MKTNDTTPGHGVLNKLGKKVLRPGGRAFTNTLLQNLSIQRNDCVVEMAPGRGSTAKIILNSRPHSYIGVDLHVDTIVRLQNNIIANNVQFRVGSSAQSNLPDQSASVVIGEAILSLQSDRQKNESVAEIARILQSGGRIGLHELALAPENIPDDEKQTIRKSLSQTVKVNARPLTQSEWITLLESHQFIIERIDSTAMRLLQPARILQDEGFLGTLRIVCRLMCYPQLRRRALAMKALFKKYQSNIYAISIIARKK